MSTIVTRAGKGSPLTNTELDSNFTNLNTDKLELSGGTLTGNLSLGDNVKLQLGNQTNGDLQIFHTGSASVIADSGNGSLFIQGESQIVLGNVGNTESYAVFNTDGAVQLRHNNQQKFSTTSTGADITGVLTADGLTVDGSSAFNATATFSDGSEARFGASNNMGLFYSSGTSHIRVNSGIFKLRADDMRFTAQNGTTDKMTLSSSNNVNIPNGSLMIGSTTAPSAKVHICLLYTSPSPRD